MSVAGAVLVVLVACSGGPAQTGPSAAPTSSASAAAGSSPTTTPSMKVEASCGSNAPAGVPVADLTLKSANGVRLAAATLGSGPRGLVMLHQTDNGMCGWWPYAGFLAQQGFHVLLFDRRCTFGSACAEGEAAHNHAADVRTAVAALRQRGATKVVVVGASLGGAVALGSCAVITVDGCVALSPALFDIKLGGGLTAAKAIPKLQVPTLVAVAPDDGDSSITEVQSQVRRAPRGVVRFVTLPAGAGHGWDTVNDPADPTKRSAFSQTVVDFLNSRTG